MRRKTFNGWKNYFIDYLYKEIKIYKLINNNLIQDLQFWKENEERGPLTLYEIEENIILFGDYMKLDLSDIRNNKVNLFKEFNLNFKII